MSIFADFNFDIEKSARQNQNDNLVRQIAESKPRILRLMENQPEFKNDIALSTKVRMSLGENFNPSFYEQCSSHGMAWVSKN